MSLLETQYEQIKQEIGEHVFSCITSPTTYKIFRSITTFPEDAITWYEEYYAYNDLEYEAELSEWEQLLHKFYRYSKMILAEREVKNGGLLLLMSTPEFVPAEPVIKMYNINLTNQLANDLGEYFPSSPGLLDWFEEFFDLIQSFNLGLDDDHWDDFYPHIGTATKVELPCKTEHLCLLMQRYPHLFLI